MPTCRIIMSSLSDNYGDLLESDFSDSYANLIVKKFDGNWIAHIECGNFLNRCISVKSTKKSDKFTLYK